MTSQSALARTLCLLMLAAPAFSQSADDGFDPNPESSVWTIALQADGKSIVGGTFLTIGGTNRSRIARVNVDGSVDSAFDPGANATVISLAVQADGKIVVGGNFNTLGGQPRKSIGRLNSDGSLDPTFNPGTDDAFPGVHSLTVQSDGRILVGGNFTSIGGQPRNRIARLNADGSLDPTFDPGANDGVYTMVQQRDGRILVGGLFTTLGGQPRNFIGRLNADGTLDTEFNPDANNYVLSLKVQADGKIVAGGKFTVLDGQPRIKIGRLNGDGTVDGTFSPEANLNVDSLAIQHDGKILVGGSFSALSGEPRACLGRLNADGSIDSDFNPAATLEGCPSCANVRCLAVQPDGKILVGGVYNTLGGQPRNNFGRLYSDGSLDATLTTTPSAMVRTAVQQPDGKILVAGNFTAIGGQPRNHIARLFADGTVDPAFNPTAVFGDVYSLVDLADGRTLFGGFYTFGRLHPDGAIDLNYNHMVGGVIRSMSLQPDGKLLIAGEGLLIAGVSHRGIARLNPDGTTDSAFNPALNISSTPVVRSIALQPDGRIVIGGAFTNINGVPRQSIGRLHSDGNLDTDFAPNFERLLNGQPGGFFIDCLQVQADGKLLVAGEFNRINGQMREGIARLNPNGSLDASFNQGTNKGIQSLALQANGKILTGYRVRRLNADGNLDSGFGLNANRETRSVSLQADGKVLAGGSFTSFDGLPRTNLCRLAGESAAIESILLNAAGTAITWNRGGAAPEVEQVSFERSFDGTNYTWLGTGTRIPGGWRLDGITLPIAQPVYLRVRGRFVGGLFNGSSSLVESVAQFYRLAPPFLSAPMVRADGAFQFRFTNANATAFTVLATTNAASPEPDWEVLGAPVSVGGGVYQFTDPGATNHVRRFYQLRSP